MASSKLSERRAVPAPRLRERQCPQPAPAGLPVRSSGCDISVLGGGRPPAAARPNPPGPGLGQDPPGEILPVSLPRGRQPLRWPRARPATLQESSWRIRTAGFNTRSGPARPYPATPIGEDELARHQSTTAFPHAPSSRRTAQRARRARPGPQPPASRNRGSCLPRGSRTPPSPLNRDPVPRSNRPSARLDAQAGRLRRTSCLRGALPATALRRNDSTSRVRRASARRESSEAPGPRLRQPTPGPAHDL